MIKFKIGRHWLVKALVGVALVATIGFSPHTRVLAGKGSNTPQPEYENVKGPDGVSFSEDGDVYFQTRDKAATHKTKYYTMGFYASIHGANGNTKVNQLNPRWYFDSSEFVPLQISDIGIPYRKAVY